MAATLVDSQVILAWRPRPRNGWTGRPHGSPTRDSAVRSSSTRSSMQRVGGFEAYGHDYQIPLKYGVGGLFMACKGPERL